MINRKRVQRVRREEGLTRPANTRKRRRQSPENPERPVATELNQGYQGLLPANWLHGLRLRGPVALADFDGLTMPGSQLAPWCATLFRLPNVAQVPREKSWARAFQIASISRFCIRKPLPKAEGRSRGFAERDRPQSFSAALDRFE